MARDLLPLVREALADKYAVEREIGRGGAARVYLAKDSRLPATTLASMYPGLDEFRRLRAEVDPRGRFASDLSRRLAL